MILDRVLGLISLCALAAFALVVVWFVPDIDLGIVTVLGICLAAYDFWQQLFMKRQE